LPNKKGSPSGLPFLFEASSKLLRQRAQYDFVDAHISRLFDGDGAGDRVGGDCLFVELVHHLAAGFVFDAELEFAIHTTPGSIEVTQAFGNGAHRVLGPEYTMLSGENTLRPVTRMFSQLSYSAAFRMSSCVYSYSASQHPT
jgi:hypothetical protein